MRGVTLFGKATNLMSLVFIVVKTTVIMIDVIILLGDVNVILRVFIGSKREPFGLHCAR